MQKNFFLLQLMQKHLFHFNDYWDLCNILVPTIWMIWIKIIYQRKIIKYVHLWTVLCKTAELWTQCFLKSRSGRLKYLPSVELKRRTISKFAKNHHIIHYRLKCIYCADSVVTNGPIHTCSAHDGTVTSSVMLLLALIRSRFKL